MKKTQKKPVELHSNSLVFVQLQLELATMINVKHIMSRVIGVQDKLFDFLCSCVEQNVESEGEVVEEEIATTILNTFVSRRGMNFHFVFRLVEDARWCTEICADILTTVAEQDVACKALFAWLERSHGALGEEIQTNALCCRVVSYDSR